MGHKIESTESNHEKKWVAPGKPVRWHSLFWGILCQCTQHTEGLSGRAKAEVQLEEKAQVARVTK